VAVIRRCTLDSYRAAAAVLCSAASTASHIAEIKGAPHGGGDAVEAVNLALARALAEDPAVVVLGEDVGVNGGVFRATVGLQKRFGPERVIATKDTPNIN
jgi:hypothetical protein